MKILYLSFLSLLLYVKVDAQTPVDLGYATLIWQDEFNYYNPNNWIIVNNGDHNGDPQLYKSGNVTFSNGKMNLLLKNEQTAFSQLDPSQIDSYACEAVLLKSLNRLKFKPCSSLNLPKVNNESTDIAKTSASISP